MLRKAGVLILGLATAGSAQAEGWSVTNFRSVPDRATCMNYAETTLNVYSQRFGQIGFIGRSDWTIGGYDMRGEVVDALFICPDEAGMTAPFLVIHNSDDDGAARETISDRLGEIWDEVFNNGGAVPTPAPVGTATK